MLKKILTTAIGITTDGELTNQDYLFFDFITQYGRSYKTVNEFEFRKALFKDRLRAVEDHNSRESTYKLGVNQFADWTEDEMGKLSGYVPLSQEQKAQKLPPVVLSEEDLPEAIDWSQKGAVTPIKNQGMNCGSCYSFSTTGAIEGAAFIKSGQLVSLSEQQIVDCSQAEGNRGCNGGNMDWAFEYVKSNPLETEDAYPYTASWFEKCQATGRGVGAITSFQDVTPNSVEQLKAAIAKGPVSVAVDARSVTTFVDYAGGVISGPTCGTQPSHAVLAVGYGTDETYGPYFKIKNEWGPIWGEDGYARIAATDDNVCGILLGPSYPTV